MTEDNRSRPKRSWIKLYCYQRLHGSVVFQLSEDEQSVWDKLLCFAGLCGKEGIICDNDGRPYPHSFVAYEMHTTLELFEITLEKCKEEGRVTENDNGIKITNWSSYQSEYDRQKPYRDAKKVQRDADLDKYTRGPYGVCKVCRSRPCICDSKEK